MPLSKLMQILTHRLERKAEPVSINSHCNDETNLEEDIAPLLPQSDTPASMRSHTPAQLSNDSAISRYISTGEQETPSDRRHSTKIPVHTLESRETKNEQRHLEAKLTQTLMSLRIIETSYFTYRVRTEHQHESLRHENKRLRAQLASMIETRTWSRKRISIRNSELVALVRDMQYLIDNLREKLEGKDTKIRWLQADLRKMGRENGALLRRCDVLWEQIEKTKREKARWASDGEGEVLYT